MRNCWFYSVIYIHVPKGLPISCIISMSTPEIEQSMSYIFTIQPLITLLSDFDSFQRAVHDAETSFLGFTRSLSLMLDEFYHNMRVRDCNVVIDTAVDHTIVKTHVHDLLCVL